MVSVSQTQFVFTYKEKVPDLPDRGILLTYAWVNPHIHMMINSAHIYIERRPSDARVPLWLMMLTSLLRKLRNMAPGRLIASGGIFSPAKLLDSKCLKNSESYCMVEYNVTTPTCFWGLGSFL